MRSAGGSCAGKTTTTRKLSQLIRERGRTVDTISLDDYYRNPENAVYLPNGKPDIEGLGSLRLDLLQETMYLLSVGKPAPIPFYDFTTKRRTDAHRILTHTRTRRPTVRNQACLSSPSILRRRLSTQPSTRRRRTPS